MVPARISSVSSVLSLAYLLLSVAQASAQAAEERDASLRQLDWYRAPKAHSVVPSDSH